MYTYNDILSCNTSELISIIEEYKGNKKDLLLYFSEFLGDNLENTRIEYEALYDSFEYVPNVLFDPDNISDTIKDMISYVSSFDETDLITYLNEAYFNVLSLHELREIMIDIGIVEKQ